jgi:hypothetical protein
MLAGHARGLALRQHSYRRPSGGRESGAPGAAVSAQQGRAARLPGCWQQHDAGTARMLLLQGRGVTLGGSQTAANLEFVGFGADPWLGSAGKLWYSQWSPRRDKQPLQVCVDPRGLSAWGFPPGFPASCLHSCQAEELKHLHCLPLVQLGRLWARSVQVAWCHQRLSNCCDAHALSRAAGRWADHVHWYGAEARAAWLGCLPRHAAAAATAAWAAPRLAKHLSCCLRCYLLYMQCGTGLHSTAQPGCLP